MSLICSQIFSLLYPRFMRSTFGRCIYVLGCVSDLAPVNTQLSDFQYIYTSHPSVVTTINVKESKGYYFSCGKSTSFEVFLEMWPGEFLTLNCAEHSDNLRLKNIETNFKFYVKLVFFPKEKKNILHFLKLKYINKFRTSHV